MKCFQARICKWYRICFPHSSTSYDDHCRYGCGCISAKLVLSLPNVVSAAWASQDMLLSHVFIRHVWTTHTHAHITYMHAFTLHMQTHQCTHSNYAHTHPTHTQIIQPSLEEIQNAVNQSVQCVLEIEQNIPLWTSISPSSTKSVQCVSLLLSKSTSGSGTSHSFSEKTCTLLPVGCGHLAGVHSGLPFMGTSGIHLFWCSYLHGYREGVLILL